MIIRVLVDNETSQHDLGAEHGLSILLEFEGRKVLFDFGQSLLLFKNAKAMGVDLSDVDYAILSHGHYDHGGGLNHFMDICPGAPVYIRKGALDGHYARRENGRIENIGLAPLVGNGVVFTAEEHQIEEGVMLFSVPPATGFEPSGNRVLFQMDESGCYIRDSFMHEQNLLIEKDGVTLLVAGCAHRGIVNILEWVKKKYNIIPQFVIGGFHLGKMLDDEETETLALHRIAKYLIGTQAKYYTGHCTGLASYHKLKGILRDRIGYAEAGSVLAISKGEYES